MPYEDAIRVSEDTPDLRGKTRSDYWTENTEPSKTIQAQQPETDIKVIMSKFGQTGLITHLNEAELQFADVSQLNDFADVMRVAKSAEATFMTLPADVRQIFENDVANFLDNAHDEDKREALRELGYLPSSASQDDPIPEGNGKPEAGSGETENRNSGSGDNE